MAERRHAEGVAAPIEPFEALYRTEHPGMVRLARLITGSTADAQEIVHDSFLKVHGRWGKIDNPGAYLRRTVVNGSYSALRRRAIEEPASEPDLRPTSIPEIDETWQALRVLSPRRRTALVLKYYEDMDTAEIAAAMRCRQATVRSLIHRGIHQLKEVLAQ